MDEIMFAVVLLFVWVVCMVGLILAAIAEWRRIFPKKPMQSEPTPTPTPSLTPPEDVTQTLREDAWTVSNPIVYDPDNLR